VSEENGKTDRGQRRLEKKQEKADEKRRKRILEFKRRMPTAHESWMISTVRRTEIDAEKLKKETGELRMLIEKACAEGKTSVEIPEPSKRMKERLKNREYKLDNVYFEQHYTVGWSSEKETPGSDLCASPGEERLEQAKMSMLKKEIKAMEEVRRERVLLIEKIFEARKAGEISLKTSKPHRIVIAKLRKNGYKVVFEEGPCTVSWPKDKERPGEDL
jgi:hypothetical protein